MKCPNCGNRSFEFTAAATYHIDYEDEIPIPELVDGPDTEPLCGGAICARCGHWVTVVNWEGVDSAYKSLANRRARFGDPT